jgi:hypothetical protein
VDPSIAYVPPASPVYFPELKKWFVCGRSHTSATPAHLVTPPHLSLVAPSAASTGDLTTLILSSLRLTVALQEPPMLVESAQDVLEVQM